MNKKEENTVFIGEECLIKGNIITDIMTLTDQVTDIMTLTDQENIEFVKFCGNGDIFVKGKLIENDMELVHGMRDFLKSRGFYN